MNDTQIENIDNDIYSEQLQIINNFLNTDFFTDKFYNTFNLQILRDLLYNFIQFQKQSSICNCKDKVHDYNPDNKENLFNIFFLNLDRNEKNIKIICTKCGKSYIL